jgi:hypothetical protein
VVLVVVLADRDLLGPSWWKMADILCTLGESASYTYSPG